MLKTTRLFDKLTSGKNDASKLASSINNNSRSISKKNDGNSEINKFGVGKNSVEHAKKLGKVFKSKKSKSEKISKSQNLAKSRKKLSKSENSTSFGTIKAKPKFLTPNAKTAFNRL